MYEVQEFGIGVGSFGEGRGNVSVGRFRGLKEEEGGS